MKHSMKYKTELSDEIIAADDLAYHSRRQNNEDNIIDLVLILIYGLILAFIISGACVFLSKKLSPINNKSFMVAYAQN